MNLHNARFPLTDIAIWAEVVGRNGRSIGVHLWPMAEGEPPPMTPKPQWVNRAFWIPPRFSWAPFQYHMGQMFRMGYVPPLCRKQSRSVSPQAWFVGYAGCGDCATEARRRGMMALTQGQAASISTTAASLRLETDAWRAAGRPDQWPMPEQT